jgi:hypothetical protein
MKTSIDFNWKGIVCSAGWFRDEHFKLIEISLLDFEKYQGKIEAVHILSFQIAKFVLYLGLFLP